MADIWVNDAEILAALNRLFQTVQNPRPALLEIGETLLESTKQRFSTKKAPDGSAWDDNSDVTIGIKGRNDPLIGGDRGTDDQGAGGGRLNDQLNYEIFSDGLDIFNTMEYAAMQQFGGTKDEFSHLWGDIPARPFLGVSDDDKTELLAILQSHIEQSWH